MPDIFLSYCQRDSSIADDIELYFKYDIDVDIQRDIRDIGKWKSIKEFMGKIRDTDYAIMIVTENYLKSQACMYEVLEAMKERNYSNRIFPVVADSNIYDVLWQIDIVKYWQDRRKELERKVKLIEPAAAGKFHDDIKHFQNISINAAEFMQTVSDMNNPAVTEVPKAIEEYLSKNGIDCSTKEGHSKSASQKTDIFSKLGISTPRLGGEFTDVAKNAFVRQSYEEVIRNIEMLGEELHIRDSAFEVNMEKVTTRDFNIQIYHNGKYCRQLSIFLGDFGSGDVPVIGISDVNSFGGSHSSYNGMYTVEVINGELLFKPMFSLFGRGGDLDSEGVTKDIWENYIAPYINM